MTYAPESMSFGDDVLDLFVWELRAVCLRNNVLPGSVLNRTRKTRGIATARMELSQALREKIGQRFANGSAILQAFPDGVPDGWRPASFPVLGAMLGVDHSTLVLANARANRLALIEGVEG